MLTLFLASAANSTAAQDKNCLPRLAFVGLHGGVFEVLTQLAPAAGVQVEFVTDEQIAAGEVDFAPFRMILPATPARGRP